MKTRSSRWCTGLIVTAILLGGALNAPAQAKKEAPAAKPAAAAKVKPAPEAKSPAVPKPPAPDEPAVIVAKPEPVEPPGPMGPYRKLAAGVLKSVDPQIEPNETVSRHDIVELLTVDPNFGFAKERVFRHDAWALDFQFKMPRMIEVDIPQPGGKMQRKLLWYMAYRVSNRHKALHPEEGEDGKFTFQEVEQPISFQLSFLLESVGTKKYYPDRVIPVAMPAIGRREDPNRKFFTTEEIGQTLKPNESAWGIAIWEDIDPKTTRFSIYVTGLTNSYQWVDDPGKYKKGDPLGTGRHLERKTLKLNFIRLGDEFEVSEEQVRFGVPGGVDYEWVYR